MIVSLIAAIDGNYGIGQAGKIPWRLSTDLKRFKALTMGHHVIMGRKTYQSIGKSLSGRVMIVVTRQTGFLPQSVLIASSVNEALELAERGGETEVFVIGGGEIFMQTIHLANFLYITHVHTTTESDVFFPRLVNDWVLISKEYIPADDQNEYPSDFCIYHRA